MEQGMASHIAVLSMIAALGMPGVDAAHLHHARAHPGLPGGFSQAREFAPAPKDMDTRDVSRDDMIGSDTMAQSAGSDMPGGRPPFLLRCLVKFHYKIHRSHYHEYEL
jgi:hypothetical protein